MKKERIVQVYTRGCKENMENKNRKDGRMEGEMNTIKERKENVEEKKSNSRKKFKLYIIYLNI